MIRNNFIKLICALLISSLSLTGCAKIIDLSGTGSSQKSSNNKKTEENSSKASEQKEEVTLSSATYNQNDYAGACYRINKIRQAVKDTTSILDEYNKQIMEDNPGDYWDDDSFFFLDFLPVYDEEFELTSKLNENDAENVLAQYYKNVYTNKGGSYFNLFKRDNNNYLMRYKGEFVNQSTWKKINGTCEEVCVYDPTKGALQFQMVAYDDSKRLITTHFYEFVPLGDNIYIFQDSDERMCAIYDGSAVLGFYYSKLNEGFKYKIDNSVPTKLNEESVTEYYKEKTTDVNIESGAEDNIASDYTDSIFFNKDSLGDSWVFEKDNFSKKIIYDGQNFDVTVLNKFNNEYENIFIEVENEGESDVDSAAAEEEESINQPKSE